MSGFKWQDREWWVSKLREQAGVLQAEIDGEALSVSVLRDVPGRVMLNGSLARAVDIVADGTSVWMQVAGVTYRLDRITDDGSDETAAGGDGNILAPMPGRILEVVVHLDDIVEADQVLLRMESMKLQVDIRSPFSGKITNLPVAADNMVDAGDHLVRVESQDTGGEPA